MPALDLGCGRGELLEVLKEAEIPAEGIDQDEGMLEGCQALGLSVQQGDAIAYLRTQADSSRICVSLIHVVEHIPFDMLRDIVAEAKRVLVPDGILIMETPNPENYTVGSCNFYMDPTHRNPLPPPLLAFVPKYYGFQKVKILRLQERDEIRLKTNFTAEDYLTNVSPDYAVVARLASSNEVELTPEEGDLWNREYGVSLPFMIKRSKQEESANE
jgi:SAM-dependent methyltransferase